MTVVVNSRKSVNLSFSFCSTGYPCPMNFNPADFYIQTLAVVPGRDEECRDRINVRFQIFLLHKFEA